MSCEHEDYDDESVSCHEADYGTDEYCNECLEDLRWDAGLQNTEVRAGR